MFTQILKPRATRRKAIVWSLGFAALFGIATLSSSQMAAALPACAPNSTVTTKGVTTVTFSSVGSCDWVVPEGVTVMRADVVAGGGSGAIADFGGGGGGGGQVVMLRQIAVAPGETKSITVGAGGTSPVVTTNGNTPGVYSLVGNDGANSSFDIFTAQGGKGGLKNPSNPVSSPIAGAGGGSYAATTITGSGSVSTVLNAGGAGTTVQPTICSPGRNGGGGAGSLAAGSAGSATATSGNGGAGVTANTLNAATYGGGGGGSRETGGTTGVATGGVGGGGAGGRGNTTLATYILPVNGTPGTGGGGGGNAGQCNVAFVQAGAKGGAGGSGIVVIQYGNPIVPIVATSAWQGYNQLSWTAYPDTTTTGYKVYWATTSAALADNAIASLPTANVISVTGASTTVYTHPNLTIGTSYYYRVGAVFTNTAGTAGSVSALSAVSSAVIPQLTDTVKFLQTGPNDTAKAAAAFDVKDFAVPAGVTLLQVNAFGASAGAVNGAFGQGGSVLANIPATPGETIKIYVGTQPQNVNGVDTVGYNGGGKSGYALAGWGGGASDIRRGGTGLINRIVVAGGGGGRAASYWGGAGGGLTGASDNANQTAGGTQTGPGTVGAASQYAGALGVGASSGISGFAGTGGGGGGGYYGGNSNNPGYGGGGGSSYTLPAALNVVHTQAGNTGNGYVTITYAAQSQSPTGVKVVPGQAQNTVVWDRTPISGATGYKVYGGTAPNPTAVVGTVTGVDKLAYVHTGLTNGTTYYYRVTATVPAYTNNTATLESTKSVEVAATPNFLATETFSVTRNSQPWTVPQGVTWIQVTAKGASAGAVNGAYGQGGSVSALLPVTPGEVLNLNVGSQPANINGVDTVGYNGGGKSGYALIGWGGGATDIRRAGTALANRILVAGGGGGRAASWWGGAGGGLVGGTDNGNMSSGGTQTGPGAQPGSTAQYFGTAGVGASSGVTGFAGQGGGGGGGYFGGNSNAPGYGGGGGSSYTDPSAENVIHTQGGVTGNGSITISYPTVAYPVGVKAIPAQGSNTIIWDPTLIAGATGYKVYGGTSPTTLALLTTTAVAFGTNSYTHTGLTIGTTYYYRVTVMSGTLESERSAEASAIPAFSVDKKFAVTRGVQTFTVPSGVYWIRTTAKGASAGAVNGSYGQGGSVSAIIPVTPGEALNIYVGSQPESINGVDTLGYNGGGKSGYALTGWGGGATDIRRGGTALTDRIIVAGGGGGRAASWWGGAGGGLIGATDNGNMSSGGTQVGPGWQPGSTAQYFGAFGVGASSGVTGFSGQGGGGGGGYYGGNSNAPGYGGGGGSSYTDPTAVNVVHTQGGVTGNGSITISYGLNQSPQNFVAVPATNKVSLSWAPSEITGLQDYQIFRGTAANPTTLLATVVAPTNVYVDSTAVNGTTYYYRMVARALVNAVATATQSTSDVVASPTAATTVSFAATGAAQTWQVPAGVSWIQVVAKGASAGAVNGSYGQGGGVSASLPVVPGETLNLHVGTQPKAVGTANKWGWNGGGQSGYSIIGGGGGATDIRRGGTALANRVLVAGGGGGRAASWWGGVGGGLIGGTDNGGQSSGGRQTGPGLQPGSTAQYFGALGVGASSGVTGFSGQGGGGGGGYYGGNSNAPGYGGGGGSSYTDPAAVNVVHTQGGNTGDGSVTITYVIDTVAPKVTGVSSPALNTKTYKAGEDIYVDVNFSESVMVTGSPTLEMNTGLGGQRTIAYVSGGGTASLRFLYTVLPGDDKTNIDYWDTAALSIANGSTIDDAAGNQGVLTLPAVGSANSLASRGLVVDGIVPVAPVLVGADGGTQITINWAAVPDTDLAKYNVYVSTDGVNFSQLNSVLATQAAQVTTFTQQVVARGITYYYYVTAVDSHGNESDPSMTTSWSIASDGTLQTPSITAKALTNNLLQPVSGKAVPGSTVEIFDAGVLLGTVTADAQSGAFSFVPLVDWAIGNHDLTAKATLNAVSSSPTTISKMVVDTVAPTFTSQLRSNPLSAKTASVVLVWKLTFSEPMAGLDTSDFQVSGTTAAIASVTQSFGTTNSYDVRVTGGDIGTVNGGITLTFKSTAVATDIAGNALTSTSPIAAAEDYILDHSYPVITLASNKTELGAGQTATITFTSSLNPVVGDFTVDDVAVVGGALSGFAVGVSPNIYTATFTPTVGFQGDATVDVPYGMYFSDSGLANLRATQLLFTVDTVAPTVTGVTASPLAGTYKAGTVVPISVIFSENVNVVGTPTLKLASGGTTPQLATYASGSGTSTLIFNYIVMAGDTATDLNYFDTASLALPTSPASTVKDAGLNSATLTLPAVTAGTAGNLAINAAIVIDTVAPSAPTALALTSVGGTVIANTLNSTNTNLTATATITAGQATSGKAELVVTVGGVSTVVATDATILVGDTSVTFNLGGTSAATLQAAITAGGSVTVRLYDFAGNVSLASTAVNLTVDYVAPTIATFTGLAITVSSAQTVSITTSEATTTFATADIVSSCGGTGTLTGSVTAYSYAWTPAANTTGSCTLSIAAGSFTDAAGNASVAYSKSTIVDNVAPTVTGVTSVSPNGTYIVGQSIDLSVNFSEPVVVIGAPTLAIKSTPAGTSALATYVSGSGTNRLVFTYAISVGDNSSDLNYAATTSLTAGTSIKDAAGNNATLTLPAVTAGTAGNLATNAALVVDALAPNAPAAPTVIVVGGTVVATFINTTNTNLTAAVASLTAGDVTGGKAELLWTPTGGTATVVAADVAISATDTTATFDLGAATPSALQAMVTGGTDGKGTFSVRLTDVSGNVSSAGTASAAITVDYVKPTVAITTTVSGALKSGQTATINFVTSEATSNFATGDAAANLGAMGAISGTSSTAYSAAFTPNADGVWSVTANAGVFTDAAGNPNLAATPITGNADVTAPQAVKVSALDALYKAGDNVDITVEFNEAVNVDVARTMTLALTPSRTAVYSSGNGTNKIVFRYTVVSGDQTIDLNYAATGAWSGSGNLADLAGNIAGSFALPVSTSTTAALAGTSNVQVDALAPTAANAPTLNIAGSSVANTVNQASANLTINATWATADATLSTVEFLIAGNVVSTQTIANPGTATAASFTLGTATAAALKAALPTGGEVSIRLIDIAGNTATSATTTLITDYVTPTATIALPAGTIAAGQTRTVAFTLSEASTTFTSADVSVTVGAGTLASFTGSGTSYSAVFTPTANFNGTVTFAIAGSLFTDAAGNQNATATPVARAIDTVAPTVTLLRAAATSSINAVTFTVTSSEDIDCSTLATGAGIDFDVVGGALTSIDQTSARVCTLNVTANATRGSPATVLISKATTFAIADLAGNTQTALVITNSPADATTVVTIPSVAPTAPTNLAATPTNASALLSWTAPVSDGGSAITNYSIQQTTVANPVEADWSAATVGTRTGSSATVTGLTNGTDYYFRVLATNAASLSSPYSNTSAATKPFTAPSAPTLTVTGVSSAINLTIVAGADNGRPITAYQWSIDGGLSWTAFGNTSLTQQLAGLVNGTAYSLKVRALNLAGPGAESNLETTTPFGLVSAPAITGITGSNATLTVSFSAPVDNGGATITSYKFSTDDGATWSARTPASAASPIVISGLTNGTIYSVKLRAVSSLGDGLASSGLYGTPMTAPSVPSIDRVDASSGQLSVVFTPGDTGGQSPTYTAVATPTSGGSANPSVSVIGSGSPLVITGLVNGETYSVALTATNSMGTSPAATLTGLTPAGVPSVPRITNVASNNGDLDLTFTSTSVVGAIDAIRYQVYVNHVGACATGYLDSPPAAATATWQTFTGSLAGSPYLLNLTSLALGTCYDVLIQTHNALGWSATSRASAKPEGVPAAPVINSVTRGSGQLTIDYSETLDNGGSPVTRYEYSINGGSTWVTAAASPMAINGLTNGTTYSIIMRTIVGSTTAGVNDVSPASSAATGTPATIPGQVVLNGSAAPGDGFIDFTVSSVPGNGGSVITGYQYQSSADNGSTWSAWTNAFWSAANSANVRVIGLDNLDASGAMYRLRAVNAIGVGAASADTANLASGTVPAAPTINGAANDRSITFTWTPGATGGLAVTAYEYRLRSAGVWGNWVATTANPVVLTGLTNGTAYDLEFHAVNARGASLAASATLTPTGAAEAPSITIASGSKSAVVSFTAPANTGGSGVVLTGYQVSIDGGATWANATLVAGSTLASGTINLAGLTNGASYPVQLRAVNAFGEGLASATATATPVADLPAAPTITSVVAGRNVITVNFTVADDGGAAISAYKYSLTGGAFDGTVFTTSTWLPGASALVPGAAASFDIPGLVNGTSYSVVIEAVNSRGNSLASNSLSATPSGTTAALASISGYSAGAGQTAPNAADYADAGITSVPTGANLAALNSILALLPAGSKDTAAEIQAIVDAFNKLVALADGVSNTAVGDAAELSIAEWALLGQTLTADQAKLANDVADETFFTSIDSGAELVAFATAVTHVIPLSASITVADAQALGLTSITSSNIVSLGVLINGAGSVAAVDTKAELLALAAQAETNAKAGVALAVISGYDNAQGSTSTVPIVINYVEAGVTGVDATNLAAVNELIGPASAGATDSAAEVQAFVDAVNKVRSAASGSSTVAGTLTAADFTALGLNTIDSAVERSLFNQIIAGDGFAAVDTIAERTTYVALIDKLLALAGSTPPALPNPTLTAEELAALGITGVTTSPDGGNLASVLNALAASANDGTGVDTLAEMQAIANAAAAGQAAMTAISAYAGTGTSPTATDYSTAGITGVTTSPNGGNLAMVNAFIAALPSSAHDSAAEIQAIVDAVNHLIAQTNNASDGGAFVTVADLTALGIATTPATATAEVALFNSIIDGKAITSVDSLAEVQAYLAVVSKITAQAAGATGVDLTVADFTFIGVAGVTDATNSSNGGNLTALMNQIAGTADNATGVDTLAEIAALVASADAVAVRDNAIASIIAYTAASGQTSLATSVYADASVSGVTGLNVSAINSIIAALPATSKDSAAEIQAAVNAYNKIYALADTSAGGATAGSLTATEFASLGLGAIDSSTELALMNAYLDTSAGSAVDTATELQSLASAVSKLAATAAIVPPAATPTPGLTLEDLAALGINGATAENLASIAAFIAASANDGTAVDTKAELQNLVNAAAAQALKDALITQISLFDGTGTAPTRNVYADAGITGVDLTNRDIINSIVSGLTPAQSDSASELQSVVAAADKINALANGVAADGSSSYLTAADTAAIGLAGLNNTVELALFNELLDSASIGDVDTAAKLAEIARIVQALALIAAGGTPNPALTVSDLALLGITGLDEAGLAQMLALVAATPDSGSGIDSLAKLQAIANSGAAAAATNAALDVISGFDGTNQAPLTATYATAGVTSVTINNLTAVNSYIAPLAPAATDSAAEIQAVVDAVSKLQGLADSITTTGTSLTAADLTALGVNNFAGNAAKLSLLNSLLDTLPFADVDTPGELAFLADIVNRMVATAMGQIVVPGLTVSDFEALGMSGVTDSPNGGNLSMIVAAVAGSGANGANIDTAAELRAVVAAAVAEFNISPTLKAIIDYANSNLNPLPTVIDYNQAGVSLVDAETLDAVNALVDNLLGADVSSADKVGTLVYNLFVALGRIVAYVSSPTVETPPSINDYRAAGLVAIDANSVSAMNAVISGLTATEVDSTSELAALLQKIRDDAAAAAAARAAADAAAAAAAAAEAERLARENNGTPYVPPVTTPVTPVTPAVPGAITKVQLTTSTDGALVLKWAGASTVAIKVISSSGQTQSYEANQQRAGQLIKDLEPGRAYAIILAPLGNNDPSAAQSVAYAVPSLTPTSAEVVPVAANKLQVTWKQQGYAKLYKVVVKPNKGETQTLTTFETKLDLAVLGGRKYEVTVTAVGEGDGASQPAVIDLNPAGAVTSVVATPFAKKKQTLVSWKPFEVKAGAKYVVKVDGKQVCLGSLTSCVVPRVLTSKNDVVVSVVGGSATAVDIDDRKLVFESQVGFVPNTTILEAGAVASIKANALNMKKAGFTKVVVTGHANPVDGVPLKISEKLANERALVIAKQLKKLLPGVRIVAIGRSVFSPAKSGAAQSIGNIRAEIYGTK